MLKMNGKLHLYSLWYRQLSEVMKKSTIVTLTEQVIKAYNNRRRMLYIILRDRQFEHIQKIMEDKAYL